MTAALHAQTTRGSVVSEPLKPPEHLKGKTDLKVVAYVWGCDDDCNCTEPVIAWQWKERAANGLPFWRRESIWTGTFVTHDWGWADENPDPDAELQEACERLGVVRHDNP
jgi:hypothetical protein